MSMRFRWSRLSFALLVLVVLSPALRGQISRPDAETVTSPNAQNSIVRQRITGRDGPLYIAHGVLVGFLAGSAMEDVDAVKRTIQHEMAFEEEGDVQNFLEYAIRAHDDITDNHNASIARVVCPEHRPLKTRQEVYRAARASDDLLETSYRQSWLIAQSEMPPATLEKYASWLSRFGYNFVKLDPEFAENYPNSRPVEDHQAYCNKFHLDRQRQATQ